MSSCLWPITVHWSRTCYVMNNTKNVVCSLSTFPVMIIYCWKSLLISSPLPFSVYFADFYAQANPSKQQWVKERKWYMEPREDARVSGEAARSTPVSSRVTSCDSPKLRAYSQATKYSWTHIDYLVFSESVSTNDDCSYPWSHPLI